MKQYPEWHISHINDLQANKDEAKFILVTEFEEIARTRVFMTSYGFPIDNRWSEKNDVGNLKAVLEVWPQGYPYLTVRDANNVVQYVNQEMLTQIVKEAQKDRIDRFYDKWQNEKKVDDATTIEEVWNAVETFYWGK